MIELINTEHTIAVSLLLVIYDEVTGSFLYNIRSYCLCISVSCSFQNIFFSFLSKWFFNWLYLWVYLQRIPSKVIRFLFSLYLCIVKLPLFVNLFFNKLLVYTRHPTLFIAFIRYDDTQKKSNGSN